MANLTRNSFSAGSNISITGLIARTWAEMTSAWSTYTSAWSYYRADNIAFDLDGTNISRTTFVDGTNIVRN